jgi:hypothetical protein
MESMREQEEEQEPDLQQYEPENEPEPETEFRLKFQGRLNEVDASTLGYSLVNVTTIIREINEELDAGRIDIKVKSTAPGSFIVRLALETLNDPLFQAQLASAGVVGLNIIKTLTELFKLRKVLKGEPPKEISRNGDDIQVHTGDNSTVTIDQRTYNLYFNDPVVNEALAKTFKTLESDQSIEGLEITDAEDHPLFESSREDFQGMALTTSVPQTKERDTTESTHVYIVKPSFDSKLKWEVLYKGNRITAWMKDKEFNARIDRGEPFAKGDVLSVELRVHQRFDQSLGTYVNKSFEIVRVIEHIPRLEQRKLWDDKTKLLPPHSRKVVFDDSPDEEK